MPFELIRGDITALRVDAIVNAANTSLAPGGGVCGAIFSAAGYDAMERACRAIGYCGVGQAVATEGFALTARYVIHTVGPIWQGGGQGEAALLRSCYLNSLLLAEKKGCRSVAFPLISAGIFGYPKREALEIAVGAIREFLREHEMYVCLTVFDRSAAVLSEALMGGVRSYIDEHYVQAHTGPRGAMEPLFQRRQLAEQSLPSAQQAPMSACPAAPRRSLEDLLRHVDDSFSQMLLRLIDEKGMTDVEVYKRANLDRKLFSKLRKKGYSPSKPTALALAVALRLNLDETRDLLGRAGYALSHSSKFDVIVEYFIVEGVYDIYEINQALFAFDQRLLGHHL